MQDSIFTDPTAIRAKYKTKGRNRKLNMAVAESLGAASSQASSTHQIAPVSGGSGGTGIVASSSDYVADPTLYKSFLFDGNDPSSLNFV